MTKEEEIEKLLEFRKVMSEFKKSSRITECFYHDKTKCKGEIIQSHILQRNGRLSIIEGEVNGNQMVYTFTETVADASSMHKSLKPIGKAQASTFFGFCSFHDKSLFSPIEDYPFDESDMHCFLHSYRSYAHSYHRKKEQLKAYETDSAYTRLFPKEFLEVSKMGIVDGVKDGEIAKVKLDLLLDEKNYAGLEYFTFTIPQKFPIACSSQISPPYSYSGKDLNNHFDSDVRYSEIMLTVLPDHDQTIIILSCFPDDAGGIAFINELEKLNDFKLKHAISAILINYAENTFFAPALWDKLGVKGQDQLCKELGFAANIYHEYPSFPQSHINFFDPRFSAKALGI